MGGDEKEVGRQREYIKSGKLTKSVELQDWLVIEGQRE